MKNEIEVKICGNQSIDDVQNALDVKVNYLGFIFAESKRRVSPKDVGAWLKEIKGKHSARTVGVFVNPSIEEVNEVVVQTPIDIIQLHGTEAPSFVHQVSNTFQKEVWKALRFNDQILDEMEKYIDSVNTFVIDSHVNGKHGGTGISFDWEQVPLCLSFAEKRAKRVFIAGGIHPNNVQSLVEKGVTGIDVASGVEKNGRKSKYLLTLLQERVKSL